MAPLGAIARKKWAAHADRIANGNAPRIVQNHGGDFSLPSSDDEICVEDPWSFQTTACKSVCGPLVPLVPWFLGSGIIALGSVMMCQVELCFDVA